jgi:NAD(P)H-nitrite reductase large subunit
MAGNRIICSTNNVDYISIRKAMCQDARTKEEIQKITDICLGCAGCQKELDNILTSICGCLNVSLKTVVNAVNDGAETIEKVTEQTGAGSDCERCKILIENIIKIKR